MEAHSLLDYLSQIPEFRKKKGFRHELPDVIAMLVMGVLSGNKSLKGLARFVKRHETELTELFELKHGTPAYGTIWTFVQNIPFSAINKAIFNWVNHHAPLHEELWLSADGKALRSTLNDANNSEQNFIYMVSLYGQINGLVYYSAQHEQNKDNEANVVRQMLSDLSTNHKIEMSEVMLRLDAGHCEKKR